MASSIADLAVNISTNIASLETGMAKAADVVGRTAREMSRQFDDLNSRIGFVTNALGSLAAAAGIGFGVKAFAGMITGAIEAQAHLQDVADKVGLTASKLSSLIPAARLSNTSIDEVAAASAKFSKNLIDVQAGTGKAAEAFKALGFSAKDAARFLADPSQGLLELGQHMNTFATNGTKTAAALALMGKGAYEVLPFLKQLGEQTELTALITDQQAAAAKRLEDEYQTLKLRSEDLRNTIASGLVPELSALLKGFSDATGGPDSLGAKIKALSADGSLAIWLHEAVIGLAILGESLVAIGKALYAFSGSVQAVVADLKVASAALNVKVGSGYEESVQNLKAVVAARNATLEDSNERWSKAWNDNKTIVSDALTAQLTNLQAYREAFNKSLAAQAQAVADYNAKIQVGTRTLSYPTSDANDARLRNALAGAGKPDVPFSAGGGAAKIDEYVAALQRFRQMAAEANAQLGELLDGRKITAAAKAFETLKASDVWAKFNAGQREALQRLADTASAVQTQIDLQTRLKALTDQLDGSTLGFAKDFQTQFATLTEAFNASIISLERYQQLTQKLLNQQPFAKKETEALQAMIKAEQQAIDLLGQMQEEATKSLGAYADRNALIAEENKLIGLSDEARVRALVLLDAQVDRQRMINAGDLVGLDILDEQIAKRQDLVARQLELTRATQSMGDIFRSLADSGARFITDFAQHGTSAFKNLWNDFKTWALEAFAKIAAQQIIIKLTAGTSLAGIAQNALAGSGGPLGGLDLGKLFGEFFGTNGPEQLAGPLEEAATGFGAIGASLGGMIPYVGLAIAALGLLGSAFKKTPSEVKGQFGVSASDTGFEDSVSTASKFGFLGFLDAQTQQFSGEAAQVFNKIVSGALDAFAGRMSDEQQKRLAGILQSTTFVSSEGTFTTEDFLQKYGGQVLQQVVTAAFDVLDPALGSVAANFKGTADQISTFANTLLAVHDASATFGEEFKANIAAALGDATQETASKVLAFVAVVSSFGSSIEGLGPKLQALDPASITAFVDALGGAASMAKSFAYLGANFLTSAERLTQSTNSLITDFANLGIKAIPTTHAQFLALLNSFDLTTAAGREMYAAVLDLSSLFVTVHGTADAAAGAVGNLAKATQDLTSATTFFSANFYSDAEKQAKAVATALSQISSAGAELGIQIPTTLAGFRQLIESIDQSTDAGQALYASLIVLSPAVFDLNKGLDNVATSAQNATSALESQSAAINAQLFQDSLAAIGNNVDNLVSTLDQIAQSTSGDLGDKLALKLGIISGALKGAERNLADNEKYNPSVPHIGDTHFNDQFYILAKAAVDKLTGQNELMAAQLAHFVTLKAQYGSAIAEQLIALEDWYKNLRGALQYFPDAQKSLDTIYAQRYNEIVTGTTAAVASLDEFIKKIQQLADATGGNAGQQAGIELALSRARLEELQSQYAKLAPTDALGASLLAQIASLKTYNQGLATQIAHFATYTAQFGIKAADQLVTLENWYAGQQTALAGNNDALAILGQIFADKWADIIDGLSSGVDGALSELDRLRKGIADYLQGLIVSNLSPLTPMEKLAQAQSAYQAEFAKAQGGDLGALGDITKFADTYLTLARDAFASSQTFTDIFSQVTGQLGDLAGTLPTGQPPQVIIDKDLSFPGLTAALPANGDTIASKADVAAQTTAIIEALMAHADAGSADSQYVATTIDRTKTAIVDAVAPTLK